MLSVFVFGLLLFGLVVWCLGFICCVYSLLNCLVFGCFLWFAAEFCFSVLGLVLVVVFGGFGCCLLQVLFSVGCVLLFLDFGLVVFVYVGWLVAVLGLCFVIVFVLWVCWFVWLPVLMVCFDGLFCVWVVLV